ncbi:carbon-nitrogen hydrolase family protein [Nitratireductor pacificus]|uniref:Nitrilase/cyanide hydratase and apolipoprotein N-acyltransferase n=1 Tax=Nitratireductor pacificus pht-3B TaxID=391937 RepID=K2M7Y7_9HYPH|nr:carbon-nitrogen hydrolase family protein [Nitratireductor pacificus]EKF18321.1 nitrilase/cyanide hydratase and apolipoprotein N-acyltransferase [Nitratireductor pacificus pht-3B]
MKATLIQMNAGADPSANIATAHRLIEQAVVQERPDLIVLPECFTSFGGTAETQMAAAEPCPGGAGYEMLAGMARQHGVFIHGGSLTELKDGRRHNTSFVFDRAGREVAAYRKMHLFSITAPDGTVYDEGRVYTAGDDVVTYDMDGVLVGCAICYDMRFPELFRALIEKGAEVIVIPAAFTLQTGKEHWEPLLRARAIETQCYVLAPGQEGRYEEDGETLYTYGHSLIVDPWGGVIARRPLGEGLVSARLERDAIARARRLIPLASHRRLPAA